MKKSKIVGLVLGISGVILVIKTIPLLAWYIILAILMLFLLFYSALKR